MPPQENDILKRRVSCQQKRTASSGEGFHVNGNERRRQEKSCMSTRNEGRPHEKSFTPTATNGILMRRVSCQQKRTASSGEEFHANINERHPQGKSFMPTETNGILRRRVSPEGAVRFCLHETLPLRMPFIYVGM